MKRFLLVLTVLLTASTTAFAARKTEAEERARFETLLKFAKTGDVPSRDTAHKEMTNFGPWIEPELLSMIADAKTLIQERQLFWEVLYDRRCRAAMGPALNLLPEAIERVRIGQIAAYEVAKLRQERRKADKDGNNARVDQLDQEIQKEVAKIPWNEIQRGDEVTILCFILADFGREEALRKLVDFAIQSSMDDSLAKGSETKFTRTTRDRLLPGGTELWNTVYSAVWEALTSLSKRSLDLKVIASQREKLSAHFDKLEKSSSLGPNQEAALQHFKAVRAAMLKTEKKTGDPKEGEEENEDEDNGGDPDVKIIRG